MVIVHPRTRQRFTRSRNNTDIILPLQGGVGLSQEKIPVIGGWKDTTGSGGVNTKQLMYGVQANQLWGTDAWIDGARVPELGRLGENIRTIRLRQIQDFIEFSNKK